MFNNNKYLYLGALVVVGIAFFVGNLSPLILLFLACPLMMIFMMRGMDHGKHDQHDQADKNK